MGRVVVTGASGFIGSGLVPALGAVGFDVLTCSRVGWSAALEGADFVVHLAGPASPRADAAVLNKSVEQTGALAAAAVQAGVTRLVFVSSVKAAAGSSGAPLKESDPPAPEGAYGRAKLASEQAIAAHSALNAVIFRSPLVYDTSVKSSFRWLLRLAESGLPLPFADALKARSLVSRATLAAAIVAVLLQPGGPPGIFNIADQPALSVGEIVALLREGMRQPPRLVPAGPLRALFPRALRQDLVVDDSLFREAYGFRDGDARAGLIACGARWKASA